LNQFINIQLLKSQVALQVKSTKIFASAKKIKDNAGNEGSPGVMLNLVAHVSVTRPEKS
jgi:hypothetical protein